MDAFAFGGERGEMRSALRTTVIAENLNIHTSEFVIPTSLSILFILIVDTWYLIYFKADR